MFCTSVGNWCDFLVVMARLDWVLVVRLEGLAWEPTMGALCLGLRSMFVMGCELNWAVGSWGNDIWRK